MAKLVGFDAIEAHLLAHLGSDETIAMFAKTSTGKDPDAATLVKKLAAWGHAVPFEGVQLHFRVVAPLNILQQVTRHSAFRGVMESTRYGNVRFEALESGNMYIDNLTLAHLDKIESYYNSIQEKNNRQREQILSALPRSTLSSFVFTCNLRGLANFFRLRLNGKAQSEIQMLAQAILKELEWNGVSPVAIKALQEKEWVL